MIGMNDICSVIQSDVVEHFDKLTCEFHRYFPSIEADNPTMALTRNSFRFPVTGVQEDEENIQEQFLELIHDSAAQSRSTPTSGPPKVSARAPAHRSYHFGGVKLKSCIKKIHHNLYISKQANVRIKHADTEGASHKKFGTDARVQ